MIESNVLEVIKNLIASDDVEGLDKVLNDYNKDEISSAMTFSNQTIFMHACANGTVASVECFIKHGAYGYGIGACATEMKSAAENKKYAAEILPLIIELVGTSMINDDGDEDGEYSEYGEVDTPLRILEKRDDQAAIKVLSSYM
jgi:ankyrin repeat protein